jgi:hypothetical protein
LTGRIWVRGAVAGVLMSGLLAGAASLRRTYVDAANRVSFSYPAGWTLNGDDDAATAKLRVALSSSASAVVTLEGAFADRGPYKGTEFEAGAFSYAVSQGQTEAQCFAQLDKAANDESKPVETVWNGMHARQLAVRYAVAGTEDAHQIVAGFRRGRCYVFETVIVSHDAADVEKPLDAARWRVLRAEFAGVMASVRIAGKSSAAR